MAETVKFSKTMENWWGKPLTELFTKDGKPGPKSLEYSGDYKKYPLTEAGVSEAKADNKFPDNVKIVKYINRDAQANAKQAAMAAAVAAAGLQKPTIANDPVMRLHDSYDSYKFALIARKPELSEEEVKAQSRAAAATFLGMEWAEDDDYDE